MKIVALIPAYNEEGSIAATIESVLDQTRKPDEIVIIPNGCSDRTADIARSYPVTVLELPRLEHKKSEALNRAWVKYASDSDLVISMDADTVFPSTAVEDWESEFQRNRNLGGSTSKFTIQGEGLLTRIQKSEFAAGIDASLRKGSTTVLAGAGACFDGEILRDIAMRPDREGPWSYTSQVEDFELTYRIREMGYKCQVSPKVRAYTDSMKDVKSLWNQRMKWQAGTIEDLLSIGLNRLTISSWLQQIGAVLNVFLKALWITVLVASIALGYFSIVWIWWILPLMSIALEFKRYFRIPHRDKKDMLIALSFFPAELFTWMKAGWVAKSWIIVLRSKITKNRTDLWHAQYTAEGVH